MELGNTGWYAANCALRAEEMVKERFLDSVFVDKQQQLVQVGTVEGRAVVLKYGGQVPAINLIVALHFRSSQELHLPDEVIWSQNFRLTIKVKTYLT